MAAAEAKIPALRLFRHLLRATSYLPDEFAQVYAHNYIKYKFRQARKPSKHTPERLKNARSSLNTLQQATNGDIASLTKVLHRAYGRSGRRRRQLVEDLLRIDAKPALEYGAISESLAAESISKEGKWESLRPVLIKFLKSQAANNPPENKRPPIRHFEPEIPKNIFERPVAMKRQRNAVKRFWASSLDKILPPLPEVEWNRLRDLATGVIPFKKPPRRRIPAGPPGERTTLLHAAAFLKQSVQAAARPEKDARVQERKSHKINARFMRRMWASVWNQCPLMTYNGETMEWTIVWGGSRSGASQGLIGSAGRKDLELFEGMDELDKVPVRPRRPAKHKKDVGKRGKSETLKPIEETKELNT
jgi:Complex 1 protein (LYR family)